MIRWDQFYEDGPQIQASSTKQVMHCQNFPAPRVLGDLSPGKLLEMNLFFLYNEEK